MVALATATLALQSVAMTKKAAKQLRRRQVAFNGFKLLNMLIGLCICTCYYHCRSKKKIEVKNQKDIPPEIKSPSGSKLRPQFEIGSVWLEFTRRIGSSFKRLHLV